MPRLAANLTLLFNELPFPERFDAAAAVGFKAVEFLFPYEHSAREVKEWLEAAGLEMVLFNAPPGDWEAGERGLACHPERRSEFEDSIELALEYATVLQPKNIHIMAGLTPASKSQVDASDTLLNNMTWATKRLHEAEVQALIEPLNLDDNPGYFLSDFNQAFGVIRQIKDAGFLAPKLQFDIYHCAKTHGEVLPFLETARSEIDHFQIADPLARNEPDPTNLPLDRIFEFLDLHVAEAFVGCEYFPQKSTKAGLKWIKSCKSASF